jgi:hypothetical protein
MPALAPVLRPSLLDESLFSSWLSWLFPSLVVSLAAVDETTLVVSKVAGSAVVEASDSPRPSVV